jgi:hypothetical protein
MRSSVPSILPVCSAVIAAAVALVAPVAPALAQCPAVLVPDGTSSPDLNLGVMSVNALGLLPDGRVVAASSDYPYALNRFTPGQGWEWLATANSGPSSQSAGDILCLAVLPNGDILVGGDFNLLSRGSVFAATLRIGRVNGSTRALSAIPQGANNVVRCMLLLPGGDVIMGGDFTSIGGIAANRVARYNPTTGVWSPLGVGVGDASVNALALTPGGELVVVGSFISAGGAARPNIARYNLATGVWSSLPPNPHDTLGEPYTSVVVRPQGDVIVGNLVGVWRYSSPGGAWSVLHATWLNNDRQPLALLPNGDLVLGDFSRFSFAANAWTPASFANGLRFGFRTLVTLPGGDLLGGGGPVNIGPNLAWGFARVSFTASPPSIAAQPQHAEVARVGAAANFTVVPAGTGPFAYQWRKDGVPIQVATNPSSQFQILAVSNVQPGDVGSYDCVVSAPCGSVTSVAASLTIGPSPCSLADVTGIGGPPAMPDGLLTGDDFNAFIAAFVSGCP